MTKALTLGGEGSSFKWEYVVLRLVPDGSPMSFSVPHMVLNATTVLVGLGRTPS